MKFFGIDIGKKMIARALFGWSLYVPSKSDPAKPFNAKITSNETDEESWIDPLDIAEDSILRQTNPLLMTRKERHDSTVRYWMERKGYSKEEIAKPLTDERMKEIGRKSWQKFTQTQKSRKEVFVEKCKDNPAAAGMIEALRLDRPSDLDLAQGD